MILTREQINRYLRQIIMPEISGPGQKKILETSVFICGGSVQDIAPAVYYLAGAGLGRIYCRVDDTQGMDKLFADVHDLNGDVTIEQADGGGEFRVFLGKPEFILQKSAPLPGSFAPTIVSLYNGWQGGLQVFKDQDSLRAFLAKLPEKEPSPERAARDTTGEIVSFCLLGTLCAMEIIKLALELGETADQFLYANLLSMEFVRLGKEESGAKLKELVMGAETGTSPRELAHHKVLIVGAGGLGAPVAYTLALAGVGTIGLVDYDNVEISNLHRQIVHAFSRIGQPKVESATVFLKGINPGLRINCYKTALSKENVFEIIDDYDVIVDALDNFPTRFLLNDACFFAKKPLVDAGVIRFDGTCMTILNPEGPCYRCRYPEIPAPGSTPSCSEVGVLGPLPGIMGFMQSAEVIKLLTGQGTLLSDRIIFFDGLYTDFCTIHLSKKSTCPLCGTNPTIHELQEYEFVCSDTAQESNT
ncbi:MAG TPA: ThiF family adenylyltransferase [Negativicutes bacterium]|nr:ThiF family adenylyltransferase [Negativicutes bacterium]